PALRWLRAKDLIHHARRPWQAPAVRLALARVVERHHAAGLDEAVPHVPVEPAALLAVVAVDEEEVDRLAPVAARIAAQRDVPAQLGAAALRRRPLDHGARGRLGA